METTIEPFRIKMVEPIDFTTKSEREQLAREADYNLFTLSASDVIIDLLTDSGTGAMSAAGWSALMSGDESYAGSESWYRFRNTVREVMGFEHVVPTHQGRAAERILFEVMVDEGDIVPNNTHFDTTRANIQSRGARAIDLPCPEADDLTSDAPFKGNIDLERLESLLEQEADERVPLIMMTITNNSGGGQPASMGNLREVRELADTYDVPFYLDACRFAENAYFIKQRESGYGDRSVRAIVAELFDLADGCTFSAKKDAFANIGGVLCTNDGELARKEREVLILTEGFTTYGGMAGRDLEAVAVGLNEVLEEDYLEYRTTSTRYVAEALERADVPVVQPAGGHAVYLNAREFLPHLDPLEYPGQALAVELYLEAGIRSCEIGTVMFGFDPDEQAETPAKWDLVRLAIPRRVYTQSHMDYVVEAVENVWERRREVRPMKITDSPETLRHFRASFDWK